MATLEAIPNLGRAIREFPVASAADFVLGSMVVLTSGEMAMAGANPALILGFAAEDAVQDLEINPGRRLAYVATPESTFWLQVRGAAGAMVDVSTLNAGASYGLTHDADDIAFVDTTKTTAALTRVTIETIDDLRNMVEVRILPEYRAFASALNAS